MKKIILGLLAISSVALAYGDDSVIKEGTGLSTLEVRVGGDITGRYNTESEGELSNKTGSSTDLGGEVALEYYKNIAKDLDFGVGIGYQKHAERKTNKVNSTRIKGGEFESIPVYVTAKINIPIESNIRPYLKANLGYSFNSKVKDVKVSDEKTKKETTVGLGIDNGLYAAGGLGVNFYDTVDVDLMMALNKSKVHESGDEFDKSKNDYIRAVLSVGYKFNF